MRYRPPSKRGRPSFPPPPKPATPRPTQVSIRKRRPHIHPPNFKESAAHSRRTQTQAPIRRRPSPNAALTLVIKRVSPHDKKYVISRAQTFILVSANSANAAGAYFYLTKRLIIKRKRSKSPNFRIAQRTRRVCRYSTDRHTPTERAPHPFPKKIISHRPFPFFEYCRRSAQSVSNTNKLPHPQNKDCISPFPAWRQIDTIKALFRPKPRLQNNEKTDGKQTIPIIEY